MKKVFEVDFVNLVLEFFGDEIREWTLYEEGAMTILLKDVNLEIDGEHWDGVVKKYLEEHGCKVRFSGGDDHWATIHLLNVM